MRLDGKVAIVTGSGTGIGRAMVMRMAHEGASVVVSDINIENMDKVVSEIKKEGGTAIGVKADVAKRSEVQDLMKTAVEKFAQIDILVNNAGVTTRGPFLEITDEDWDLVLAVDLKGAYNCMQAVAGYMIPKRYGKIINISSQRGMGTVISKGGSAANYAAAKSGVNQLTQEAAVELGPYGINVNCIAPGGGIVTQMTFDGRTKEQVEARFEEQKNRNALKRVFQPEDIANVALFLASDESAIITGQCIICNGGGMHRM